MARALGGELGWDEQRTAAERRAWAEVARDEGLVPGGLGPPPASERREESTLGAGAAPEEAA